MHLGGWIIVVLLIGAIVMVSRPAIDRSASDD